MSYLYLSYHTEFSGRVISTSCKINCDRKEMCQYLLDAEKNAYLSFDQSFFQKCEAVFLVLLDLFFHIVSNCPFCGVPNVCSQNPWLRVHKVLSPYSRIIFLTLCAEPLSCEHQPQQICSWQYNSCVLGSGVQDFLMLLLTVSPFKAEFKTWLKNGKNCNDI